MNVLRSALGLVVAVGVLTQLNAAGGASGAPGSTDAKDALKKPESVGMSSARLARIREYIDGYMQRGGRTGFHSEHLGHMLAEMQVLPRTHPGATW